MQVLDQIGNKKIQIYTFPDCDSNEDEEFIKQDKELKEKAMMLSLTLELGHDDFSASNGWLQAWQKRHDFKWAALCGEAATGRFDNPDHCDFTKLRQMLISMHMQDLKDMTHDVHYENYRAQYIKEYLISGQHERIKLKRVSTLKMDGVQYTDHLQDF
ncbi:Septin-1 [Lamellibrachia satsuma]|nr:Septin-1 [Lamellibrachia satsuma]